MPLSDFGNGRKKFFVCTGNHFIPLSPKMFILSHDLSYTSRTRPMITHYMNHAESHSGFRRDLMDTFKAESFLNKLFVVCSRGGKLQLDVNLDPRQVVLARDVRALSQLAGFKAIPSIQSYADELERVCPYSTCLSEAIRTYFAASRRVAPSIAVLLSGQRRRMHRLLQLGMDARVIAASKDLQRELVKDLSRTGTFIEEFVFRRGFEHLDVYARKLHECALDFESQVSEALAKSAAVGAALNNVATCALERDVLASALSALQEIVGQLELLSFSNLGAWVAEVDKSLECILVTRLEQLLGMWMRCFQSSITTAQYGAAGSRAEDLNADVLKAAGTEPNDYVQELARQAHSRHEIRIKGGALLVDPPLGTKASIMLIYVHSSLHDAFLDVF
jgi:dynein heavy chain 1